MISRILIFDDDEADRQEFVESLASTVGESGEVVLFQTDGGPQKEGISYERHLGVEDGQRQAKF